MILNDLTQKIINEVFGFYVEAAGLQSLPAPTLNEVSQAINSETKRFKFSPPTKSGEGVELWFSEDPNKNIIFTFAIPADLLKADIEKAEIAKKAFDKKLQEYLVDYYI
jgi:hypothetical protein